MMIDIVGMALVSVSEFIPLLIMLAIVGVALVAIIGIMNKINSLLFNDFEVKRYNEITSPKRKQKPYRSEGGKMRFVSEKQREDIFANANKLDVNNIKDLSKELMDRLENKYGKAATSDNVWTSAKSDVKVVTDKEKTILSAPEPKPMRVKRKYTKKKTKKVRTEKKQEVTQQPRSAEIKSRIETLRQRDYSSNRTEEMRGAS